MFEFKVSEELQPNTELLELLEDFTFIVKIGKIKNLANTNLQFIEPTAYAITEPLKLTILEYKINEISNKPFYVLEKHEKYNLTDLKSIFIKLQEH